jgi:signal transduction histidine kinase
VTGAHSSGFNGPRLRRILEGLSRHRGVAAALTVPAAVLLALLLRPVAQHVSFVMLVPAVIATAWYSGVVGGLVAAGVAAAATAIFLTGPLTTDAGVELFVIETVVVFMTAVLAAALGHADRRLAASLERERQLRAEAEAGSLAKSDFLAMLAHELRQPIGALIAASTLFKDQADAAVQGRASHVIVRQAQHLARLIEDLSDVSKVHVQRLDISLSDVKLNDVLTDVVETLTPLLNERQQSLRVEASEDVILRGDGRRLRQILSNLLGNAVKFTNRGGRIHVSLEVAACQVEISITDTGAGIAAADLPTIFDLFRRGSQAGSGLGIGLALVKAFAEAHGGTVHAYSAGLGHGSRFTVRLPLKQPTAIVSDAGTIV